MLFLGNVHKPEIPYKELADLSLHFLPYLKDKEYECKLFTWDSRSEKEKARQQKMINLALKQGWTEIPKEPRWTYQKGLIVLKGDKQAMKDAYSKYKRKKWML